MQLLILCIRESHEGKRKCCLKTPSVFSCYLHFLLTVRLQLFVIPRFMSPSDVAAPFLHLGAAL